MPRERGKEIPSTDEGDAFDAGIQERAGLWQTGRMDVFQKLFGYKEPTLIVAESDSWTELPASDELDRAIAKRAKKEKWAEPAGEAHKFHCLVQLVGAFSSGSLEVDSLGSRIAIIDHETGAETIERMRADNGVRTTAVKALATRDDGGRWRVSVNI